MRIQLVIAPSEYDTVAETVGSTFHDINDKSALQGPIQGKCSILLN